MRFRDTTFLVMTTFVAAAAAGPLSAQNMTLEDDVDVSFRVGPTIPSEELADISDTGGAVGADLAWWFSDRLALNIDGNVDILPRSDDIGVAAPDLRLWHYGAGLEVALTPRDDENPWTVMLRGGAGASTMDSDDFLPATTDERDFTETYFNLNSGLEVGYDVNEDVRLATRGSVFAVFTDEDETALLASTSAMVDPFDTAVTFPITAELEIDLH